MDIDIKELIKIATENLNLKEFKGDVVAVKVVENEFGTIEEGGIGVQNIYSSSDNPKSVNESQQNNENNGIPNKESDALPQDCLTAVTKVVIPTIVIDGGVVLKSQEQICKAAAMVDLTSNVEVAMLMNIGIEVGTVKATASCPDFVRALIGMGIIAFKDNDAISRIADGMSKKRNGYTRGGKKYPPLPANHLRWSIEDQPIGRKLYDAMKS